MTAKSLKLIPITLFNISFYETPYYLVINFYAAFDNI
jgi:hypothetical protein